MLIWVIDQAIHKMIKKKKGLKRKKETIYYIFSFYIDGPLLTKSPPDSAFTLQKRIEPKNTYIYLYEQRLPRHFDLPSLLRFSQLISWEHSLHTVLDPAFVPWLLKVSRWARLLHLRGLIWRPFELLLACWEGTLFSARPSFDTWWLFEVELALDCWGAVLSVGTSCITGLRSGSSKTVRWTSSHSIDLWKFNHAMSCSSLVSLSASFSCRRVSCSW